jgi:diacylglycerol O-acyltransferase / wax synthase
MFKSLTARREPMSRVDTAWLRMERPTNLMMITGVLVFDSQLDLATFKQILSERFLAFRRFRQRAVEIAGQSFWEYDKDFDLNWHIRRMALPGNASKQELEEYVSQLASTPLDKSKPLWQFHIVENYQGGSALITRIHHCYADGIALVQVMLSLTDVTGSASLETRPVKKMPLKVEGGTVFQRLLEPARVGFDQVKVFSEKAASVLMDYAKDPEKTVEALKVGAGEVGDILSELATAITLPDDPHTVFRGPLGVSKRVAWCDPIPLETVKSVGKALDCTVNDVLMSCAAGALRGYMLDQDEPLPKAGIRATVPVNLRPLEHAKKLGNHFGLVFLDLPVHEANPLARLFAVRACMQKLKSSRQAIVSFGLLAALGLGPAMVQRPALEMFSRKATAVATNVPGPQMPLYLAGCRLREQMFWVPQTGTIGMGISILSYNGFVHFGLIVDKKNVAVPDLIVQRFMPELEKLLMLTLMGAQTVDHADALSDRVRGRVAVSQQQKVKATRLKNVPAKKNTALARPERRTKRLAVTE